MTGNDGKNSLFGKKTEKNSNFLDAANHLGNMFRGEVKKILNYDENMYPLGKEAPW